MPGPLLRRRSYFAEWLVLLAFMLVFVGTFAYSHHQEYRQVEAREYERLSSQAALIDKNLVSQIDAARHTLGSIAQQWVAWRSEEGYAVRINRRLMLISDTLPGVRSIVVLDTSGRVVASNNDSLLNVDLSGRDYFQHARLHPDPQTLFVTHPFQSTSKRWVIGMYRVMTGPDGQFAGLVLVGIDSRYFRTLLESACYTPDAWTYLAHGDGKLFMTQPEKPEAAGMVLTDADGFFVQHMQSGRTASTFTGRVFVTGEERLIAFRTIQSRDLLMDKPLVISISRDRRLVFADWMRATKIETSMFALLAALSALGLYSYQRRQRTSDRQSVHQQEVLQASETLLHAIFDASPDAMLISDDQDVITMTNHQVERVLGFTEADLTGHPVSMLVPERFWAERSRQLETAFAESSPRTQRIGPLLNIRALCKDGSECDVEVSVSRITTARGHLFVNALRDITDRKRAQEQLRIAATAFESQEAMIVTDLHSVILQVNQAFTRITGFRADEVVGQNPRLLKSGHHDANFYRAMWQTIQATGSWQGEVFGRRKNGEIYPKWLTVSAVKGEDGQVTHYVGAHHDMTEHKKAQEKINDLAFFDQLTNLPNRILLMDRVRQAMTSCMRTGSCGALIIIDLDNFKTLNDTLGHDRGDHLLKQVAQRLLACVRVGDTVARLGGDEFVVLLTGLSPVMVDAASSAETLAQKILTALNVPYTLDAASHHSTASLGATMFNGLQTSADELMRQADLAMYRSKDAGRNALRFFDITMEIAVRERAGMEGDLRQAVSTGQFTLYYQAQVDDVGGVTGAEVLLRWMHPRRGLVSPADFIPLAEETGLILPMGRWVLETACQQLARWADRPAFSHLVIAVNVSAIQFMRADFVDQVLAVLQTSGADPSRLKLELTESLLVDKVEEIASKMAALKAHGVGFSLDDFGTGYSSLAYLKRLPLDQLKIDQSFVRDILIDPNDAAIAKTIVALAKSLGLGVIAEGVETQAQMDFLAGADCHAYQGYLFGRPIPLAEFEVWVESMSVAA